MSFLLDTDICSAFLKGDRKVWQKFTQYMGRLRISVVTAAELHAWSLRAKASQSLRQGVINFLNNLPVLAVDLAVAEHFGQIRAAQLDQGQRTPGMDLLIASTALVHGLTLVTHNTNDYKHIPNLRVDDWLTP